MVEMPYRLAYVAGQNVNKGTVKNHMRDSVPHYNTIAEVRALTTAGHRIFIIGNYVYLLDAADTTTADNGTSVIVSADGGRYKLQGDLVALGADLNTNGYNIKFADAKGILDDSGKSHLIFRKTASAVNYFELYNAAAGGTPMIRTVGSDPNVGFNLNTKGTGEFAVNGRSFAPFNSQIAASSATVGASDFGRTYFITAQSTISHSGVATDNRWWCAFKNISNRRVDFVNVDGGLTVPLFPGQACIAVSDGTNVHLLYRDPRWKPAGVLTIFADASAGIDTNDGLSSGAGNAKNTIQACIQFCYQYLDYGFSSVVKIKLATGTYAAFSYTIPTALGSNQLEIEGNDASPGSCIVQVSTSGVCGSVRDYGILTVHGIRFLTTGNGSIALSCSQFAVFDFYKSEFGAFPLGIHIAVSDLGSVNCLDDYSISGGAVVHIQAAGASHYNCAGGSQLITITGTPAFTIFFTATGCAVAELGAFNATGAATGQRHHVSDNAVVHSGGSTLPGSTAGQAITGGIYT